MKKLLLLLWLVLPFIANGQIITTIAGTGSAGYSGDGGPATAATFNLPHTVRIDNGNNIYISDVNNNVIRKINASGIITTVVGTGEMGYSGDGDQATNAKLNAPTDVAIDALGNLYIPDNMNNVIRKVNASGVITTIAGTGVGGYSGDGGPATAAELYTPYSIALDDLGNLYISDASNSRIRKINTSGIITTVAGNGTTGYAGDGSLATDAEIFYPGYIAVSSLGDVYIPDQMHHVVRKVNSSGIISTVAGNGVLGSSGDGSPATAAELHAPNAVNFDNWGNYYISDPNGEVVRKVNTSGIISTIAGTGVAGFSGDGGAPLSADFNWPDCVAFNSSENMYIADYNNNIIRKITYHPDVINNIINSLNIISIFPNPASDALTINSGEKIETIEITNLIGQSVYKQSNNNTNQTTINISGLANDVYFIKVNGIYSGKFVKE